jgi:hypothetical protein
MVNGVPGKRDARAATRRAQRISRSRPRPDHLNSYLHAYLTSQSVGTIPCRDNEGEDLLTFITVIDLRNINVVDFIPCSP